MGNIIKELIRMVEDLYTEGYMCGINENAEEWHEAWAITFKEVADGKPYNGHMVLDNFHKVIKE